jgi:Fe-S cluster assembly protein SufD
MQSTDQKIKWYQSEFQEFEKSLKGEKTGEVHALRRSAIRDFAELGFPTNKEEEWRFTNIAPIAKLQFKTAEMEEQDRVSKKDIQEYLLEKAVRLVFVNGKYSKKLSDTDLLPRGVLAGSLAEVLSENPGKILKFIASLIKGNENAFTALNTAFLRDGAFLFVPHGVELEPVIQLIFVTSDRGKIFSIQPRNLIIAESGSKFKISETYIGLPGNPYWTNAVTEILLGEGSSLEHNKIQFENLDSYHIGTTCIRLDVSANYSSNAVSLGGSIVRNNITAVLDAEGSECTLNGLSLAAGTQLIDNHTVIDHAKPHCSSHELYKAVLDGDSKGVFNGKIFVRKDAQKTDAKQTNKTLLLSDEATIDTKPQLEIFADDVKCTHGATIGQLDAEQLFYLQTRGIDIAAAREMLTFAFAEDVVGRISIEPLRVQLTQMIRERLKIGGDRK